MPLEEAVDEAVFESGLLELESGLLLFGSEIILLGSDFGAFGSAAIIMR